MKNDPRDKARQLLLGEVVDSAFIRAALGEKHCHKTTAGMIRTQIISAARDMAGGTRPQDITLGQFLDSEAAIKSVLCRPGKMGKKVFAMWEALLRKLDLESPEYKSPTDHLSPEAQEVLKLLK